MPRPKPSRAQSLFAEHYAESARYHGDEAPKKAATAARRTATSMATAAASFQSLLTAEQRKALADGAAVLRNLAGDLDDVCKMARKAQMDYADAERIRRETAADSTASARWLDDEGMFLEAHQLAAFIDQHHALEVDRWLLGRPQARGCTLVHMPDLPSPGGRLVDMLHRRVSTLLIRRRAAEYLAALQEAAKRMRHYKDLYYAAADDYEAWRVWREAIRSATVPPMSTT